MITYKQLKLSDVFENTQTFFEEDKPKFLKLLGDYVNLGDLIPRSFYDHYYSDFGRPRKYHLESFLCAFLLQKILSVPTESLLINMLRCSKELRGFCGFEKVPDASKFTRFKQEFVDDLQLFFDRMVDITEPICQAIDAEKASMTIFDTTGVEAYVTENNEKFLNSIIRNMKRFANSLPKGESFDPLRAAYSKMPTHSSVDENIKQQYVNGHICYAYKAGILTNGLGIIRAIDFIDSDYLKNHPDIHLNKKERNPDEDKSASDSKILMPILKDFFRKHPLINPDKFLGDAAFDSAKLYGELLSGDTFGDGRHFNSAYIPLGNRFVPKYDDCPVNENGIPCCPNDHDLPMRSDGSSHRPNGMIRYKFVCPKSKDIRNEDGIHKRICSCETPCTESPYGRMIHIYPEKDLRLYPGTLRGTAEWDKTYKNRTVVERTIEQLKSSFCIAGKKTRNPRTSRSDLLLGGITQLITVYLSNEIYNGNKILKTFKPLLAA